MTAADLVENLLGGDDDDQIDPKSEIYGIEKRNPGFAFIGIHDLDSFTRSYLEAAWFTDEERLNAEAGEAGFDMSEYSPDWSQAALERAKTDCDRFQAENAEALELGDIGGNAAHDFWYTRNGHGAGFWDGDWNDPWADQLVAASRGFGEANSYVGDDGLIYFI
jgi:hypothetical protein